MRGHFFHGLRENGDVISLLGYFLNFEGNHKGFFYRLEMH